MDYGGYVDFAFFFIFEVFYRMRGSIFMLVKLQVNILKAQNH